MISATHALARLQEGNRRFVANQSTRPLERRAALLSREDPFAIVLGRSDSRVPAELVFDQGFGDLFVIRIAGNIVAPSQIGSVEFAASRFGTRLVVVMGHSYCGAVLAALEEAVGGGSVQSRNLRSIVERIRPAVDTVLIQWKNVDRDLRLEKAIRANVCAAVNQLKRGSSLLEQLIRDNGLVAVGADYSLESGNRDVP